VGVERVRFVHQSILLDHTQRMLAHRATDDSGDTSSNERPPVERLIEKTRVLPNYERRAVSRRKRAMRAFAAIDEGDA
jgi:hypothetical protein